MRRLALLVALALLASACGSGGANDEPAQSADSAFEGIEVSEPAPAPEIALRDQDGKRVLLSQERGKVVLVTFLYTRCPDVCPIIAESLNRVLVALGDERSSVRVLAVSVDPTGDTPERVRSYAAIHRLRPEFHYLIGSRRELEPVWRDYDVQAFAADPENELVEHTAQTLLVDPDGMVQLVYPANATADAVLQDVRLFLQG